MRKLPVKKINGKMRMGKTFIYSIFRGKYWKGNNVVKSREKNSVD